MNSYNLRGVCRNVSQCGFKFKYVCFFFFSYHFQTPASNYPGVVDDLIFSGAGSGCRGDDEDECTPPFESGSGDDLITPVYVPPTKQPTTPHKTDETSVKEACDDEDCIHGSGDSGSVTESFTSTTSKGTGNIFDGPILHVWNIFILFCAFDFT